MIFFIPIIFIDNIHDIYAQHHGASPPLAVIGDRKISMNFTTEPSPIMVDQPTYFKIYLHDLNSGEKIQHVTYRVSINKDDQSKISDFFHSHTGDLSIMVKNNPSQTIGIGGTFDVLTNAYIPDPSGILQITGPVFPESGIYNVNLEVTTMDNDKTDLSDPLKYHFDIKVQ